MTTVVFASNNQGKIKELHSLLSPLGFTVKSQADFGIQDVAETATTFVENALLKARESCRVSGLAAIADDSGLEVDALDGAPGLYSARFAAMHNRGTGDAANNQLLLARLAGVPDADRGARFRSVVVYLRHVNDPAPIIAEATWEGHILYEATGSGGFGYDPIFCNNDTNTATASLAPDIKNRLSHRGKAVALMVNQLTEISKR